MFFKFFEKWKISEGGDYQPIHTKTSPVGCQELSKCAALLTQTFGKVNAPSVSIAEAFMQKTFQIFSTPKIRQIRHFGDHFYWKVFCMANCRWFLMRPWNFPNAMHEKPNIWQKYNLLQRKWSVNAVNFICIL